MEFKVNAKELATYNVWKSQFKESDKPLKNNKYLPAEYRFCFDTATSGIGCPNVYVERRYLNVLTDTVNITDMDDW
jgi:hypothetical protein